MFFFFFPAAVIVFVLIGYILISLVVFNINFFLQILLGVRHLLILYLEACFKFFRLCLRGGFLAIVVVFLTRFLAIYLLF